jgi:transcriptional regulator with XRE-family HTH domain
MTTPLAASQKVPVRNAGKEIVLEAQRAPLHLGRVAAEAHVKPERLLCSINPEADRNRNRGPAGLRQRQPRQHSSFRRRAEWIVPSQAERLSAACRGGSGAPEACQLPSRSAAVCRRRAGNLGGEKFGERQRHAPAGGAGNEELSRGNSLRRNTLVYIRAAAISPEHQVVAGPVGRTKGLAPIEQIDAHVARRLRERRKELGISQGRLGNRTGVTFSQIQKYENGVNRIGAGRLYLVAVTLGVPVPYFFEGLKSPAPEAQSKAEATAANAGTMRDLFVRISDPKARQALLSLASSMAEN